MRTLRGYFDMATLDDILDGGGQPPQTATPSTTTTTTASSSSAAILPKIESPNPPEVKTAGDTGQQTEEKQPEQHEEKKRLSYVDMFNALNPQKPETDEERVKRKKREKSEAILAAVGDGISALSNLYFTSRYAHNAHNRSMSLSAKAKERWGKLKAERDANSKAYADGYARAVAMDEAQEREDRNWRHTLDRERIADERYEIKEARDKAMADLNEKLRKHQIDEAEYKAERERIAADYAERHEKLKLENERAGVRQKNAAADASNARARYYDSGGSGGRKSGPTLQLEADEPMRFDNDKDYDRAVMRLASEYGVATTEVQVTEFSYKGDPIKQRTIQRPVKDIAADIEREAAKRKKSKKQPNPMGGGEEKPANGKKKNPMS